MKIVQARKERERVARENLILENAQRLVARDGFQGLNLDELAAAVEYSKGTIYLHFETKEDLVLAVATRSLKHRADLLERAAAFQGTTRERARAMSFACCQFVVTHPEYFALQLMLEARSFWDRVSKERQSQHLAEATRIFRVVNQMVLDALEGGDLPRSCLPQEVTLSLMAVTMGSHCAVTQPQLQKLCEIEDPLGVLRMHQDRMLDGWGWKPLSHGGRHDALDGRIQREVFPEATWFKS